MTGPPLADGDERTWVDNRTRADRRSTATAGRPAIEYRAFLGSIEYPLSKPVSVIFPQNRNENQLY
ncbi:hypothetical protein C477_16010 [Haloterrigena salina JCM 13891]|uniref:Uncharacterized protein n=1 Tax=Haloterrigena salina JCM 13891 TaxID=1227488 RepID=M0C2K8_9EURY|nr:hypothetical protein C477_16010 [Haloterrigena salina JCM 13891]